ncbi:MAG TPA: LLM class F420-dependent oxidoreductase [Acidimicrobiales bacterium]|nr:LLM class F420-dependent oxidoreductase [Acidimicrobiales bacterium]
MLKFDVGVPSGAIKHFETWVGEGTLNDFAVAAERAGFDAVHVTDHPFPEDAWLANGGHHAFDPFVALSSMSAVTSTIGLRTNLLVAGYRNPYLAARSIASLDVLSGGRVIVGMGAGYLQAEFGVLGADFATRGKRFDEAIEAMTAAWSGESVERDGTFYPAHGHSMVPAPVQRPRPPLWVGGNSVAARRRAALLTDGWMPFPQPEVMAAITGSPALTTLDDLKAGIDDVHALRSGAGLTGAFDVAFSPLDRLDPEGDPDGERFRHGLAAYEDIGVTWLSLGCRGRTLVACQEELDWLAEAVIGPYRRGAG